jgi:DMSO reductase anchor subunit
VATVISSFFRGVFPERTVFFPVIVLAALASFFHLGKPVRSWRSVANFKHSPLSREIVFLIIYITLCAITLFFQLPGLLIAASIAGLCLLLAIDSVYIFADKKKSVTLHSGQAFLSALLIASFFSGIILPFIFIALVKLAVSVYSLIIKRMSPNFEIRFLRMAFLIVTGLRLISHNPFPDLITISIFLTGEFFDRMLFYIDFDPVNINTLIDRQLNIERDEKKRG